MKIHFLGATREVTGSCYLIETDRSRLLVDCGMFQGSHFASASNFKPFDFDPATIDAVTVTHGHLDHTGRIPKLVKEGFQGPVYATAPTADIAKIVLEDAVQVMRDDAERKGSEMLYRVEDVDRAVTAMRGVEYSERITLDGLSFRFRDAGHIFGSSFIEVEETDGARAVFSGDIGNTDVPILRPTAQMFAADALVIESTYGNRIHEDESTRTSKLREAIMSTINQNGVLIIPAFAVERTQQVLYELNHLVEHKHIPPVDIYLDSPMAIRITDVIKRYPQYYDTEARRLVAAGDDLFDFPGLHRCMSRDDSKKINDAPRPKVIISGAGMMNGGRIQHHLVRYLSDPHSTVLIIGYQAEGTLGRKLYSGEKRVDVLGEHVAVHARITSIGAYSAHADQHGLLTWIQQAESAPRHVYCTHGEEDASAALATRITEELHIPADVPRLGDIVTL